MSLGSVTNVTGTLFRMRNTFCWIYEDSPTRLRTFLNQPYIYIYIYGVAYFVAECLALFPFGLVSGLFQASAEMPPRGIYSDITLPYLYHTQFGVLRSTLGKCSWLVGWQKKKSRVWDKFDWHSSHCSSLAGLSSRMNVLFAFANSTSLPSHDLNMRMARLVQDSF